MNNSPTVHVQAPCLATLTRLVTGTLKALGALLLIGIAAVSVAHADDVPVMTPAHLSSQIATSGPGSSRVHRPQSSRPATCQVLLTSRTQRLKAKLTNYRPTAIRMLWSIAWPGSGPRLPSSGLNRMASIACGILKATILSG